LRYAAVGNNAGINDTGINDADINNAAINDTLTDAIRLSVNYSNRRYTFFHAGRRIGARCPPAWPA
jgi:hypothetical protein